MEARAESPSDTPPATCGRGHLLREAPWFAILFVFVFLLHYLRLENGDIWEHVKIGEIIVKSRGIPEGRPILWTVAGEPWLPQSWLFQVAVYGVWRVGGLLGLYLWDVALIVFGFGLLYRLWRQEGGSRLGGAALVVLGVLASAPRFQIRPDACTAVGLALLLSIWAAWRRGKRKTLWPLLPLGLIWANMHIGVMLGALALLVVLAGETWERIPWRARRGGAWPWSDKRWRHLLWTSAGFALTTVLTPSLWRLHLWLLSSELRQMIPRISENLPLWQVFPYFKVPISALAALVGATIVLVLCARRRIPRAAPLLLLVFLPLALRMMRQVWPLVMVSLGVCALAIGAITQQRPAPVVIPAAGKRWPLALGWVTLALLMAFGIQQRWGERVWTGHRTGVGINADLVPIGAANWLLRERPPGRIFNTFEDAYYLAFRLWPAYGLFIDGFTDYPLDLYTTYLGIGQLAEPTPALDAVEVTIIIMGPAGVYSDLARRFEAKDEWVAVYGDGVSTVYLRNSPRYADLIRSQAYRALRFASASVVKGQEAEATKEVQRIRQQGVPTGRSYTLTGMLWQQLGDPEKAEADLRTAVSMRAGPVAQYSLAMFLLQTGRDNEAQKLLSQARRSLGPGPPTERGLINDGDR